MVNSLTNTSFCIVLKLQAQDRTLPSSKLTKQIMDFHNTKMCKKKGQQDCPVTPSTYQ